MQKYDLQGDFRRADAVEVEFTYEFESPALAQLEAKWGLRKIAGEGSTQERALNLLRWLCAHTRHGNPQSLPEGLQMNAGALLDWAFDRPESGPNGKHLSVILSECLLAVGIKAYMLWGFPRECSGEKTCVTQAFLPGENRWILLDPSFGFTVTDKAGRVLGAWELRERLSSGLPLRLNPGGRVNWYFQSMAKNFYYFNRARDTKPGLLDTEQARVFLLPAGYEPAAHGYPAGTAYVCAAWDSFWK